MYNQIEIGNRLRKIRELYLIGIKISIAQFAELVGEPKHNIAAYESGKANIPNRLFVALYERGINPVYILTGEGSVYSQNEAGKSLRNSLKDRIAAENKAISSQISDDEIGSYHHLGTVLSLNQDKVSHLTKLETKSLTIDELLQKAEQFTAAAGDIMKIVKQKRNK